MTGARSVQVEELRSSLPTSQAWGAFRVRDTEGTRLEIVGWVLGVAAEIEVVQVLSGGRVVATTVPHLPREDMAEQFPERDSAATCGFAVTIEARGRGESLLELRALLEDGTEAQLGEIRVLAPGWRWSNVLRRH